MSRTERLAYGAIAAVLACTSFVGIQSLRAGQGAMHREIIETPHGCVEQTWRAGAEDRAIARPISCNAPIPRRE